MKVIAYILTFFLFFCTNVFCTTRTVTNTKDSGEGSLRYAIKSCDEGDDIVFELGSNTPQTITIGSRSNTINIGTSLTINGPGAELLTLKVTEWSRALTIEGTDKDSTLVTIRGLKFTGGNIEPSITDSSFQRVGGIEVSKATLVMNDCEISGNNTTKKGGGIYASDAILEMNRCVVSGNKSGGPDSKGGGGIYVSNTSFAMNSCEVTKNESLKPGGGIYSENSDLTMTDCRITVNKSEDAYTGDGGGLFSDASEVNLRECEVSGNTAGSEGGGLRAKNGGISSIINLEKCAVVENSGGAGGGIMLSGIDATLINCTVASNKSSSKQGGAINVFNSSTDINQCTIVDNGSGLYLSDTDTNIKLKNSILSNDTNVDNRNGGVLISGGYNLSDKRVDSFDHETDQNDSNLNLGGYDTKTHTYPLLPGSEALDLIPEGENSYNGAPDTDQRGTKRPQGRGGDVGACEMEPFPPSASAFTVGPVYQNTAHVFATTDFGYSHPASDPLDHVRIVSVPDHGYLWVDKDHSGTINGSESAISDNGMVSLDDLNNGCLLYLNTTRDSSFFTFDVSDGMKYSPSRYKATLIVVPEPSVTLSQLPDPNFSEHGGTAKITVTLSHVFDKDVTANLSFSAASTCGETDYSISSLSIVIQSGITAGEVIITGLDDSFDEGNETLSFDLSSVVNGVKSEGQQVNFTLTDDDTAGMALSKTDVRVVESGNTDSFTVALTAAPLSNVVINITSEDMGEVFVKPASLTFTPEDWNRPKEITVTAADDRILDGDKLTIVSMAVVDNLSDSRFHDIKDGHVSITTKDNEVGWTGDAGNSLWSDSKNWMHGVMPHDGDTVVLTGAIDDKILLDQTVTLGHLVLPESFAGTLVQGDEPLTIDGDFYMAGGSFTGSRATITIDGSFNQTGGLFASTSGEFRLSGDFDRSGGIFTAKDGSVILTGLNQTVSGSTTFYRLICLSSSPNTLRFEKGSTQVIENLLRLEGRAKENFLAGSTHDNHAWNIRTLGTVIVDTIKVQDCHNTGPNVIVCGNSTDVDNNEGLIFSLQDPPIATFAVAPTEPVNAKTLPLEIGGIGVVSYRSQINDGVWSDETPINKRLVVVPPDASSFTVKVRGKSSSGVWQEVNDATTTTVHVDKVAPTALLLDGPQGEIGRDDAAIRVCGDDVVHYQYALDGAPWSGAQISSDPILLSDLNSGEHTLSVVGSDAAGNWQEKSNATVIHWSVNESLPAAILAGGPAPLTQKSCATITVMESGAGMDQYAYALDDGPWRVQSAKKPIELFDLTGGNHTLYVNAAIGDVWQGEDGENRIGATTLHWTIDQTPPVAPSVTPEIDASASSVIRLSWMPQLDATKYRVWYSDTEFSSDSLMQATELHFGKFSSQLDNSLNLDVGGLEAGKTYWFGVKAEDKAGNTSPLSIIVSYATTSTRPTLTRVGLINGEIQADNSQARELEIRGTHFLEPSGTNLVRFSSTDAVFDLPSRVGTSTHLRVDIPKGIPVGDYTLRVLNKYGSSLPLENSYTVNKAPIPFPEVSLVMPVIAVPGNETEFVISGNYFGLSGAVVQVVGKDGTGTDLNNIVHQSDSCLQATLDLPENFPEGLYTIRVGTESDLYNDVSAMKVEVRKSIDLSTQTGKFTTPHPVKVGLNPIAVETTLTTDSRSESNGAYVMQSKITAMFEPDTLIEKETQDGWQDFDGIVLPPRQIPVAEEIGSQFENGCLVFSLGSSESLRLKENKTIYMQINAVVPEGSNVPSVYYVAPDNTITLAGMRCVKNGITMERGGTVLSVQNDIPEPGFMTYTLGLMIDHMSTYAIGTKFNENSGGNGINSDIDSNGGPCFISGSKDTKSHSVKMALLPIAFLWLVMVCIWCLKRQSCS